MTDTTTSAADCPVRKWNGSPCKNTPSRDTGFCWMHSVDDVQPIKALSPLVIPDDTEGLSKRHRAALERVRREHGLASPYCAEAAVITESCGHGGAQWICWGCRDVIAGSGQSTDPCIDHFQIRAVDPDTMNFLCSPLPRRAGDIRITAHG